MLKTIAASLAVLCALTGCTPQQEAQFKAARTETANDIVARMVYVEDKKNGYCFAYSEYQGDGSHALITNVPCKTVQETDK